MSKKLDRKFSKNKQGDKIDSMEFEDEESQAHLNCMSQEESGEAPFVQGSKSETVEGVPGNGEGDPMASDATDGLNDPSKRNARSKIKSLMANRSSTSLELAIEDLDKGRVNEMISGGIDVNEIGRFGLTPLMVAISKSQIAFVKMLMEGGANPNILSDGGSSVFSVAVRGNKVKIIRYLLALGVNVDLLNHSKETPLMEALKCERPSQKIIGILIDSGASILRKSSLGESPLSLVEGFDRPELIRFFSEKTGYRLWSDKNFEELIRKELRHRMRTRFQN